MSQIIAILNFEEGYVESPYLDTQGFPAVAGGIRIGPQGASLSNYHFLMPRLVGDTWKLCILESKLQEMKKYDLISQALKKCNRARSDVLYSMACQPGIENLARFQEMLKLIAQEDFNGAAKAMFDSAWAQNNKGRARRHAEVMRTGNYDIYRGLI